MAEKKNGVMPMSLFRAAGMCKAVPPGSEMKQRGLMELYKAMNGACRDLRDGINDPDIRTKRRTGLAMDKFRKWRQLHGRY